jgi:hypothetical protein
VHLEKVQKWLFVFLHKMSMEVSKEKTLPLFLGNQGDQIGRIFALLGNCLFFGQFL